MKRTPVRWVSSAVVCLVALFVLTVAAWRLHKSRTVQLFGELVTAVATEDSVIALTFDDGPSQPYTDSILELLRNERVLATFFVTGAGVERYPGLARRIVAEGHELGNHSYAHRRMVLVSPSTVRYEVELTDSLIRDAGARGPIRFRPPYGKRLLVLPWYLSRTDRVTVLWTLEPDSWFRSAAEMVRHVIENARPGSIVLLHVELPSRVAERDALRQIISGLRERGYALTTVSQLMERATNEEPTSGTGRMVENYFKGFQVFGHDLNHRGQVRWLRVRAARRS